MGQRTSTMVDCMLIGKMHKAREFDRKLKATSPSIIIIIINEYDYSAVQSKKTLRALHHIGSRTKHKVMKEIETEKDVKRKVAMMISNWKMLAYL